MNKLDVVNEMLGTLGEAPLATLTAPHTLRGSCLRALDNMNDSTQARGWWFNRELLRLQPSVIDGTVYLPGDAIGVRFDDAVLGRYSERAGRVYDNDAGDWLRAEIDAIVIRRIDFDSLPTLAADAIGLRAIVRFQRDYDGDTAKTRDIKQEAADAWSAFQAEETRQTRANRIASNRRLMAIKSRVYARRTI